MFCYAYARVRLFELPHGLDEIDVDSISKRFIWYLYRDIHTNR